MRPHFRASYLVPVFFPLVTVVQTFGQGDLNPTTPPGPTFKTLQQIEPRTPISVIPTNITAPGSYYLTTNLIASSSQSGITISANDVRLDLNGFALIGGGSLAIGVAASSSGITNLVLCNGVVRNWGEVGVYAFFARNSEFAHLRLSSNNAGLVTGDNCLIHDCASTLIGNGNVAIDVGNGSTVRDCTAAQNYVGIRTQDGCSVSGCSVRSNFSAGIIVGNSCTVKDCVVDGNGQGLVAGDACTIQSCAAAANGGNGISAHINCAISSCVAQQNTANGIRVVVGTVIDCTAASNTLDGISLGDGSIAKDCTANVNGGNGISANASQGGPSGEGDQVIHCIARQNGLDGIAISTSSTIEGCTAAFNTRDGINVLLNCKVIGNTCINNGFFSTNATGAGVHCFGFGPSSGNHVEGNYVEGNVGGIQVDSKGNLIIRNTGRLSGALGNYHIAGTNSVGEIIAVGSTTSTVTITNSNPWANFSY